VFDALSPGAPPDHRALALAPIDHVGIAVHYTADALRLYVDVLGLHPEPTEIAADENLKITFLDGANSRVEILEPLPGDSPVARFLDKRGEGMHHICFVVPDIVATLRALAAAGYQLVDEHPRLGRHGELVAFVHPRPTHGVLIELYQVDPGVRRGTTGGWTNGSAHPPDGSEDGESLAR
jgi:methylmalonyl-CoA epimerase